MDPVRPDPNPSDPNRLLPKDNDTTTFEISKNQQQPETPSSSFVTVNPTLVAVAVDEDNDGFRTPVNQEIPVITECPPAPRKTRIPLRKRKGVNSPSTIRSARKRIQIDPTEEEFVDALFLRDIFRGKIIQKGAV